MRFTLPSETKFGIGGRQFFMDMCRFSEVMSMYTSEEMNEPNFAGTVTFERAI